MKVLVVGGGGREHALAWKLAQSDKVQQVYVAPGNGGTARDPNLVNLPITDIPALRAWGQAEKSGVTLVGAGVPGAHPPAGGVAPPCPALFMGAALGFALGQSAAAALLVFFALGLGMALPYHATAMAARTLAGRFSNASRMARISASFKALRLAPRVRRTMATSFCSPVISTCRSGLLMFAFRVGMDYGYEK